VPLARSATGYEAAPFAGKAVLLQAAPNSYAQAALLQALRNAGGEPVAPGYSEKLDVVVFDASGWPARRLTRTLYETFHGLARKLACERPRADRCPLCDDSADPVAVATARGVEGFARSLTRNWGAKA
jgi:3-oxoacyl-[acyl-carrier protein] reductase